MWLVFLVSAVNSSVIPSAPIFEKHCYQVTETGERKVILAEKGFIPSLVIRHKGVSGYQLNEDGVTTSETYVPKPAEIHLKEIPCDR